MVYLPLLGIMVPDRKSRVAVYMLYKAYFNLPGKLFVFARKDILWDRKKIIGIYQIGNKIIERYFPFPDAVYNRCYNKRTDAVDRISKIIGRGKCFNCINWFNKWQVHSLLYQSELNAFLPDTFLLNEVNISDLMKKYKFMFVKPSYGNLGKKVFKLDRKENEDVHISHQSAAPRYICRKYDSLKEKLDEILGEGEFIIQEGIRSKQISNQKFDIRVLVQKNISGKWVVSSKVCRIAHELYYNTAVYDSIYEADEVLDKIFPDSSSKQALINSIDEISLRAAEVLEEGIGLLGELSVDIVLDEEMNLKIIEVNGKPQKKIYNGIDDFKFKDVVYQYPLQYAYYLATN